MDILEFRKRCINLEPFGLVSQKVCLAHLLIIENMCSKFNLDDLKTVGGVINETQHIPDHSIHIGGCHPLGIRNTS